VGLVRKAGSSLAVNTRSALKYCYKCFVILLPLPARPHNDKPSIADPVLKGRVIESRDRDSLPSGKAGFLVSPVEDFEAAGREQLDYLRKAGLSPGSKLVDLGCGACALATGSFTSLM
jgi:hypothetical protein